MPDKSADPKLEKVIDLAETRKALDSLDPPPPAPVREPMAPIATMSAANPDGRPPTSTVQASDGGN